MILYRAEIWGCVKYHTAGRLPQSQKVYQGDKLSVKMEWVRRGRAEGCWYPGAKSQFIIHGVMYDAKGAAEALGISVGAFRSRLVRYRNWKQAWPEDCGEVIDGKLWMTPRVVFGDLVYGIRAIHQDNYKV